MHRRHMWTLAFALLVVATSGEAQSRTTTSTIRISKDAATTTVSTTPSARTTAVVSGGDVILGPLFDVSVYANNMNEKNITAHMATGDSLDVELARLAQGKAINNNVRNFATILVNDHGVHLGKTIEIITDEDVGAQSLTNDPELQRMRQEIARLRDMPSSSNWDAAFLRFQAAHHQNEIDILNANVKNAHDDDLEEHIEDTLKSLARHRDMAREIAASLGFMMD